MLRKIFPLGSILLLLLIFSQCDRCINSVEDISRWELIWDKAEPFDGALPGVNFEKGIMCPVPSEEAVYFLNPTGECWKFTERSAGGVTYEQLANFPGITGQQAFFAFPAGDVQEQHLHVGMLDHEHVTMLRYKDGAWEAAGDYSLDIAGLKNSRAEGTACAIREEDRLNGWIVLQPNTDPVVLIYDVAQQTLEPSTAWNYKSKVTPNVAIEIAPNAILLGRQRSQQRKVVAYLGKDDTASKDIEFRASVKPERLSLFVLEARGLMRRAMLVLHTKRDKKTEIEFYTFEVGKETHDIQFARPLPEVLEEAKEEDENEPAPEVTATDQDVDKRIDHSESLVIPFSDTVYIVTKDKDGRLVYYKGDLRDSKKHVEKKADSEEEQKKEQQEEQKEEQQGAQLAISPGHQ